MRSDENRGSFLLRPPTRLSVSYEVGTSRSAPASSPTNWPISLTTSTAGPVHRLGQPPHQGAADDQAVGHRGKLLDLLGRADAEADADGQIGLGPQPGHVVDQVRQAGSCVRR